MSATGGINWEDVKQRLREGQRALEQGLHTSADELAAVYRSRAAQLASRGAQGTASADALRVLVFALGTERYAIELADLVELLPFVACTPVPGGPPQLLGVLNVQGEIRSVVDLGQVLDLPDRAERTGGYVLLVRKQGRSVGLRVDHLDRIQLLLAHDLVAPGDTTAGPSFRYLRALTPDGLRLLDTAAVLARAVASPSAP